MSSNKSYEADLFTNLKTKSGRLTRVGINAFPIILSFITDKEKMLILFEVNKGFMTLITKLYMKENSLGVCIKEIKGLIKSIEEYKFITNNHCINIEDNLKKIKDTYQPFIFYRSIYLLSNIIFKDAVSLDIQKNNIGMDGILLLSSLIRQSKNLININLAYNNICNDGCKFLVLPLSKNKSLQVINLECNCISDSGVISISDPLMNHPTLKILKFALNLVTFDGLKYVAEMLEKSENSILGLLDFKYNNVVVKEDKMHDYFKKLKIAY